MGHPRYNRQIALRDSAKLETSETSDDLGPPLWDGPSNCIRGERERGVAVQKKPVSSLMESCRLKYNRTEESGCLVVEMNLR